MGTTVKPKSLRRWVLLIELCNYIICIVTLVFIIYIAQSIPKLINSISILQNNIKSHDENDCSILYFSEGEFVSFTKNIVSLRTSNGVLNYRLPETASASFNGMVCTLVEAVSIDKYGMRMRMTYCPRWNKMHISIGSDPEIPSLDETTGKVFHLTEK